MPSMPADPRITLRYFDARGRAQFVRYYLRARNIVFEDERVPLSADFSTWLAIRDDRAKTGPFHKLPVLYWGDSELAETFVIADFLHRISGDHDRLSTSGNLRHAMLVSSLYVDVMTQIGTLIWADVATPGADLGTVVPRVLERVDRHLGYLDEALAEWRWLEGAKARPLMIGDCLLWEELDVVQVVFGERLALDRHSTLAQFHRDCPGRAVFETVLQEHPCPITGRPNEAQALAAIRRILAPQPQ
jgi:glutathione S-transferase